MANIEFQDKSQLCKSWLTGYTLSNAIVYSTAVLLVVLNAIIVAILGRKAKELLTYIVLTSCQRFHTKTEEKASSIIKMFLIQFINTVTRLESLRV